MFYFDSPSCDYLSLGFAFDEGLGENGEINVMASASLQHCNGTEITNYDFNGTGLVIYDHNPCSFKGSLKVENALNNSQFVDYVRSIISNTSDLAHKKIYFSENDQNNSTCTAFILDLVKQDSWLRNYTTNCCELFIYRGQEYQDCINSSKNWNKTSDLLGMARESAYEISIYEECNSGGGTGPQNSPSEIDGELKKGLIFCGVLFGVLYLSVSIASAILFKKQQNEYSAI